MSCHQKYLLSVSFSGSHSEDQSLECNVTDNTCNYANQSELFTTTVEKYTYEIDGSYCSDRVTEFLCNHLLCNGSQLCEQSCVDYFIVENICSKYLQDALQTIDYSADNATMMCSQLPSNDCVTLTGGCAIAIVTVQ